MPRVKAMVSHAVALGSGEVPKETALMPIVSRYARIAAGMKIRPAMVGVPALYWWAAGPSSRIS